MAIPAKIVYLVGSTPCIVANGGIWLFNYTVRVSTDNRSDILHHKLRGPDVIRDWLLTVKVWLSISYTQLSVLIPTPSVELSWLLCHGHGADGTRNYHRAGLWDVDLVDFESLSLVFRKAKLPQFIPTEGMDSALLIKDKGVSFTKSDWEHFQFFLLEMLHVHWNSGNFAMRIRFQVSLRKA